MSHSHGISNTQLLQTALNATDRTASTKNAQPSAAGKDLTAAASGASTTNLSGAGTSLAATGIDDVRTDKVAALKSAIDSGTYNVSAGDVADKLINHLLE